MGSGRGWGVAERAWALGCSVGGRRFCPPMAENTAEREDWLDFSLFGFVARRGHGRDPVSSTSDVLSSRCSWSSSRADRYVVGSGCRREISARDAGLSVMWVRVENKGWNEIL